jgi:hypothetical protein
MSTVLTLPNPMPPTQIALGQITTNPLSTTSDSISSSVPPEFVQKEASSKRDDPDSTSHITITEPLQAFETLRREPTTQDFLRKMSQRNLPLYFVTGLQMSKARRHKRAAVEHESITEDAPTPQPQLRLPFRRVDSASNMASPGKSRSEQGFVVAVELLKVKCRIGAVDEPHCISDVDYVWSYHLLDNEEDGLQLSIGLGKPVKEDEWKALAGIAEKQEERAASHNWSYDYEDSDDGLGGF